MRRPGVAATLVALALGFAGLVVVVLIPAERLAFSLGVPSNAGTVDLRPGGREVCQTPVQVPGYGRFDRVSLALGTYFKPRGPQVDVRIRDVDAGGRVVSRGRIGAGYPDIADAGRQRVTVDPVGGGRRIAVCLANRGDIRVAVFGSGGGATESGARRGRRDLDADLDLSFYRSEPRSLASLAPTVADRAALFRPGWVGPWTYWVLGLAVVLAVPALVVRAVRSLDA